MVKTNKKRLGEVIIISEELLKLYSPLSKNVDVDKVYPYLHLAQQYYLEDVLGISLLEELQHQVEDNCLTEENKALILKCAPVLANYACYLALRSLTYSVTEKSLVKEHSENSEAISRNELGDYILSLKETCEMHKEVLIKYLCRCSLTYPLWRPLEDCDCQKYIPNDGSADVDRSFSVYFPNKKKDGCDGCNRDVFIKKY